VGRVAVPDRKEIAEKSARRRSSIRRSRSGDESRQVASWTGPHCRMQSRRLLIRARALNSSKTCSRCLNESNNAEGLSIRLMKYVAVVLFILAGWLMAQSQKPDSVTLEVMNPRSDIAPPPSGEFSSPCRTIPSWCAAPSLRSSCVVGPRASRQ
jgi:hypothetical protein